MAGTGEAIAEFDSVTLFAPRGKVTIGLHSSYLKLQGSTVVWQRRLTLSDLR